MMLSKAADLVRKELSAIPAGTVVRYPDVTLILANKGVVLSASAMSALGRMLTDNGDLNRISKQKFVVPLVKAPTAPKQQLTTEQRLFLVEQELAELKRQVAELSNRLL